MSLTIGSVSVNLTTGAVTKSGMAETIWDALFAVEPSAAGYGDSEVPIGSGYVPGSNDVHVYRRRSHLAGKCNALASALHTILTTQAVVSGADIT